MSTLGPLRAIAMVGGSQVANIAISIVRVKLVAMLLGPTGIGLLGLLNNIKEVGGTVGGLGLATSGVRQIAQDSKDINNQSKTQKLLLFSLAIQGGVTALIIWLLRDRLAEHLFPATVNPQVIGIIAVSVWISLVSSAMTAVLQGMRRITELIGVTIYGALIGTVIGLSAIMALGQHGLPFFVFGIALGQLLTALWFFRRADRSTQLTSSTVQEQFSIWFSMVRLGIAFMAGALLTSATLLFVRNIVQQTLGLDALGQFEATWALTMTYLGFVLNAMAADYFPRLSSVIHEPKVANAMVNEQLQLALILGGPLILATIGLAPIALTVLYTSEFKDAAPLLQLMTLGNIFKLGSWSMGFTVVAKGRSGLFMLLQLNFNLCFTAFLLWQIDNFGTFAIGAAFIAAYGAQMIMTWMAARTIISFSWEKLSLRLMLSYFIAAVILLLIVRTAPITGAIATIFTAGASIVLGLRFLLATRSDSSIVAVRAKDVFERIGWPIPKP